VDGCNDRHARALERGDAVLIGSDEGQLGERLPGSVASCLRILRKKVDVIMDIEAGSEAFARASEDDDAAMRGRGQAGKH
jgi:hypothetical protein